MAPCIGRAGVASGTASASRVAVSAIAERIPTTSPTSSFRTTDDFMHRVARRVHTRGTLRAVQRCPQHRAIRRFSRVGKCTQHEQVMSHDARSERVHDVRSARRAPPHDRATTSAALDRSRRASTAFRRPCFGVIGAGAPPRGRHAWCASDVFALGVIHVSSVQPCSSYSERHWSTRCSIARVRPAASASPATIRRMHSQPPA